MSWTAWNDAAITLTDILMREGERLAVVDYAGAVALTDAKRRALDGFERAQTGMGEPPALGTISYDIGQRLSQAAIENRQLLGRAMVVQARVIDCFARAMPASSAASRYGARGMVAQPRGVSPVALLARA